MKVYESKTNEPAYMSCEYLTLMQGQCRNTLAPLQLEGTAFEFLPHTVRIGNLPISEMLAILQSENYMTKSTLVNT